VDHACADRVDREFQDWSTLLRDKYKNATPDADVMQTVTEYSKCLIKLQAPDEQAPAAPTAPSTPTSTADTPVPARAATSRPPGWTTFDAGEHGFTIDVPEKMTESDLSDPQQQLTARQYIVSLGNGAHGTVIWGEYSGDQMDLELALDGVAKSFVTDEVAPSLSVEKATEAGHSARWFRWTEAGAKGIGHAIALGPKEIVAAMSTYDADGSGEAFAQAFVGSLQPK
jgi:hypothetical protein